MSDLIVLKYGSSVLANCACLGSVVHDVYRYYRRGARVLAVVSAIGEQTNELLTKARQLLDPPAPQRAVAELLATGERQSAALLVMALYRAGIEADLATPESIALQVVGNRLDASPVSVRVKAVQRAFRKHRVLIVPGFSGIHEQGGSALLGRGGSDLTAVFLAHALGASRCRLVKDVDGIYEHDPADISADKVSQPARYREVTYEEALRISGQLVQPKAIDFLRTRSATATVCGLLLDEGTEIGRTHNSFAGRSRNQPQRVLLLGFGHVGQGVYSHLTALADRFSVTGIWVRHPDKSRDFHAPYELLSTDLEELMNRPYDLVVDVSGDLDGARRAIELSLRLCRPAVTASKQLIAEHGRRLEHLAANSGSRLYYSAAAGGAERRESGKGAGRWPTAEAVIADLLDIAEAWAGGASEETSRTGADSVSKQSEEPCVQRPATGVAWLPDGTSR